MVQVTKVRQIQADGSEKIIAARAFDKAVDGAKPCLCPDPGCTARMGHVAKHDHTYPLYPGTESPETRKLRVPDYFRRLPGSPPHAENCSVALAYQRMAETARSYGGVRSGAGFVFNLNIMTDNRPGPVRSLRQDISPRRILEEAHARASGYRPRQRYSESVSDISKLAKMLEQTAFDPEQRETMALRDNGRLYTLAEIYHDDPLKFFRTKHAEAKAAQAAGHIKPLPVPAVFVFKPVATPRSEGRIFWNEKEQTIISQPAQIKGLDTLRYAPSVRLNFTDASQYQEVTRQIRGGVRSFLVYDDRASVNLKEFAQRKEEIRAGKKGHAVFVDIHVVRAGQIMAWTPMSAQMDFTLKGMDPPRQPKSPRQMGFDFTG